MQPHVRADVHSPTRRLRFLRLLAVLALIAVAAPAGCRESTSSSPTSFTATLRGVEEVPANSTTAFGSATFSIASKTMSYEVTATGFTTPLVVAHMVIGAPGNVGPVIVPFDILSQSGTIARGTVDLSGFVSYNTLTISGDSLRTLMELGLTYVNLHTAAFPGGEIRGQLVRR